MCLANTHTLPPPWSRKTYSSLTSSYVSRSFHWTLSLWIFSSIKSVNNSRRKINVIRDTRTLFFSSLFPLVPSLPTRVPHQRDTYCTVKNISLFTRERALLLIYPLSLSASLFASTGWDEITIAQTCFRFRPQINRVNQTTGCTGSRRWNERDTHSACATCTGRRGKGKDAQLFTHCKPPHISWGVWVGQS